MDELKAAIARANNVAHALAALAETMERNEPNPNKRAVLTRLLCVGGEWRDRLHGVALDLTRAGLIQ